VSREGALVPTERIVQAFLVLRGERVLLDEDLAEFYGVETRALNQAVTRNAGRFPDDFAFRLTPEEWDHLRSHPVISSRWGGRRYPPRAFTEQGVAMLSSVLRSEWAVAVNVGIMRAFVRQRRLLASNEDLAARLDELAARADLTDARFEEVFALFEALLAPEVPPERRIGFHPEGDG